MSTAVLSLGSNLGDRIAHLRSVVDDLGPRLRAVSPVYETGAWGVTDQPDFLNAVVIAEDPELDGWGWLRRGQALERAAGRVRTLRWGPRTLDVDVVRVRSADGREIRSDDPELVLPHPGTAARATVLQPWCDADPDAVLDGVPVARLLLALDPAQRSSMRLRRDLPLRVPS